MTTTITTSPANLLQKLPYGTASATINFTTDGTAPLTVAVTASANAANFTVPSNAAMIAGDFYSIEGGGLGGTVPWTANYNGKNNGSSTVCATNLPASVVAVTGATAYRYERFEGRFRPTKITLSNQTNGDVYVWDQTLLDDQAKYTPSGGSTTTLVNRGILCRSNCIGIHPNLLPLNSSFSLKCEYNYRG
jgi:hypothetical protein